MAVIPRSGFRLGTWTRTLRFQDGGSGVPVGKFYQGNESARPFVEVPHLPMRYCWYRILVHDNMKAELDRVAR
jgi:hypothetical protein